MRINQNTASARPEQPPAPALHLPTDPDIQWSEYLDLVSAAITRAYPDQRAQFIADLVRSAADQAHLHGLDSHLTHYAWLMETDEDYEPGMAPDDGPAAPTAQGTVWGCADAQWDLRNL